MLTYYSDTTWRSYPRFPAQISRFHVAIWRSGSMAWAFQDKSFTSRAAGRSHWPMRGWHLAAIQ